MITDQSAIEALNSSKTISDDIKEKQQFKVGRYNAFDIDEKTSGSSKKSFQVCGDSGDGLVPEVLECGNCFATQFEIKSKYPKLKH